MNRNIVADPTLVLRPRFADSKGPQTALTKAVGVRKPHYPYRIFLPAKRSLSRHVLSDDTGRPNHSSRHRSVTLEPANRTNLTLAG
jgi:hypothetical protein